MKNNKKIVPIGEAARYLGVSIMTLRRWDASGKLPALKMPSGYRYYEKETLEALREDVFAIANIWAASPVAPDISKDYYCETQDRFRARLEHIAMLAKNQSAIDPISLITAIAGEIGNNSFDHNLGNWPDIPGVFFAWDLRNKRVILADRGVGIETTLSRVRTDLKDDIDALTVAMTERISGRAPEQRGNGLKFVAEVASENPIGISLHSGIAIAIIGKRRNKLIISSADRNIRGVLAKIEY